MRYLREVCRACVPKSRLRTFYAARCAGQDRCRVGRAWRAIPGALPSMRPDDQNRHCPNGATMRLTARSLARAHCRPCCGRPGPPGPSHLAMKRAVAGQSSAHLRAPEIFTAPVTPAGATHSWRSCECDGPGLAGLGTGDWTTNYANCCRRLRAAAASCPLRLLLACRFPIPDSRFPVPDSRFPIPDSRFPIPR